MPFRRTLLQLFVAAGALVASTVAVEAQGKVKVKHYTVTHDRAIVVTRDVLVRQGYYVVRVEDAGDARIVYYRRGNMGKGKGKGPVERLVIRRVHERVIFESAPPAVLVDIDVRLRL